MTCNRVSSKVLGDKKRKWLVPPGEFTHYLFTNVYWMSCLHWARNSDWDTRSLCHWSLFLRRTVQVTVWISKVNSSREKCFRVLTERTWEGAQRRAPEEVMFGWDWMMTWRQQCKAQGEQVLGNPGVAQARSHRMEVCKPGCIENDEASGTSYIIDLVWVPGFAIL